MLPWEGFVDSTDPDGEAFGRLPDRPVHVYQAP